MDIDSPSDIPVLGTCVYCENKINAVQDAYTWSPTEGIHRSCEAKQLAEWNEDAEAEADDGMVYVASLDAYLTPAEYAELLR